MRPIRVDIAWGTLGEQHPNAMWVACDSGRAVIVSGTEVFCVPFDSLEVLPCDAKGSDGSELSSGSKPAADSGSATSTPERRKRRKKRAPSPRGPRPNQWKPTHD